MGDLNGRALVVKEDGTLEPIKKYATMAWQEQKDSNNDLSSPKMSIIINRSTSDRFRSLVINPRINTTRGCNSDSVNIRDHIEWGSRSTCRAEGKTDFKTGKSSNGANNSYDIRAARRKYF